MTTARKKQPGAASRVGGSVRNTAAQFMMKNRPEEFTQMLKYNTQFQGRIKQFGTVAENIAQERYCKIINVQLYLSFFRHTQLFPSKHLALQINTFTANYELSHSPGFLYFFQPRDNSYFRDPLFLPTTSYLVGTKFIIFANCEITRTTLFLIFHLFTQKRMDFIIFVGKLKTQRILIRVFQTFLKKHFLYCHATRYLVVENMGSVKSA